MSAATAWAVTVVLLISLVLVFHFIGWDITGGFSSAIHGLERALGHPLSVSGLS